MVARDLSITWHGRDFILTGFLIMAPTAAASAAQARELAVIADLLPGGTLTLPLATAQGPTETAPEAAAPAPAGTSCPTWRGAKAGPGHTCL